MKKIIEKIFPKWQDNYSAYLKNNLNDINKSNWHWGWSVYLFFLVLINFYLYFTNPMGDGDIWFHIFYGKYFLEHGTMTIDHSIFSWTPANNNTIYHVWLPDIIYYFFYNLFGLSGIFIIRFIMLIPFIVLLIYFAKIRGVLYNPLTWLFIIAGQLMIANASIDKPEIFTFMYFTVTVFLYWYMVHKKDFSPYYFYLFPLIMLLWVNSHGGFIFGLSFLFLISVGEILNIFFYPYLAFSDKLKKHFFIAMILSAFVCLLTPYGIKYPIQLFNQTFLGHLDEVYYKSLMAYNPTFDVSSDLQIIFIDIILFCFVLLLLFNIMKKNINFSLVLTNLLFAYLYTKFTRTTFFWGPVFCFSVIYLLSITPAINFIKNRVVAFSIAIIVFLFLSYNTGHSLYIKYFQSRFINSVFGTGIGTLEKETDLIDKYMKNYKLCNTYVSGAYLMWRLWPDVKVMMDPRQFPYPWYPEYRDLEMGKNIDGFLNKYNCDIFLVENRQNILIPWLMNSKDWNLVYLGKIATIFKRSHVPMTLDAYGVQKEDLNFQNFYEAIFMLNITINYFDFETARFIVNKLESKMLFPKQKEIVRGLKYHIDGVVAYYNNEYEKASDLFQKAGHDNIDNRKLHANSLFYLAQNKWENDDIKGTYDELIKIVKIFKGPHNLYNLGVIKWYADKNKIELPYSEEVKDMSWSELIENYIKSFGVFQYQENIVIAQNIIKGVYNDKPPLLIPFKGETSLKP